MKCVAWAKPIVWGCLIVAAAFSLALGQGAPDGRIIHSGAGGQVVEQSFGPFVFEQIVQDGKTYVRMAGHDYLLSTETGKPELPVRSVLVAIPEGSALSLEIVETESATRIDHPVYPSPAFESRQDAEGTIFMEERFVRDEDVRDGVR